MSSGGGATSGDSNNTVEPVAAGLDIQTSAYGLVVPIVFGRNRLPGNLLWYGAFIPHAVTTSTGGGGGGGKGGGGGGGGGSTSTTWTYTASMAIGICEGPITSINNFWDGASEPTAASGYFTPFLGSYPQSPWSYLTSNFPGQDLGYNGQGYAAAANYSLGSNTSVPNFSWDITGISPINPGTIDDADPTNIVSGLLANPAFGAGFPAPLFGAWGNYQDYCFANSVFLSPVYNSTQDAASMLGDLMDQSNAEVFFSEAKLKIVTYGDTAATGNGHTFTPNLTPAYDLEEDDLHIVNEGDDPVKQTRKLIADAYNFVQVEILDRDNFYNTAIVTAKDLANIQQFGLRPDTSVFQAHAATSQDLGQFIAEFRKNRALYLISTYEFNLPVRFCDLEQMDIVTLPPSRSRASRIAVRLKSFQEGDDGIVTWTAEDLLDGTAAPAKYSTQAAGGYSVNFNISPGDVNPPILIDGPGAFTLGGFEIWAAISGSDANWGGCEIWVSTDNASYKKAGVQIGRARYGLLTANFPAGSDPDTVNQCKVDLTISSGELVGGARADADNDSLLCYVDGELISYQDATLTAANKYTLGTYIRRGVNNTPIKPHALGAVFARLDGSIFKYPYDESLVGQTVYLKFLSFNKYNGGQQLLADVTAYPFTIGGSLGAPAVVTNFAVSQNGAVLVFQWGLLPQSNVDGYEIRYNPLGSHVWENGTPLTQVTRGTSITTAKVPPGAWTFMIKARDSSLQYSQAIASADLVVINQNIIITLAEQDQAWLGAKVNFLLHPTGVLVPDGQNAAGTYTSEWIDEYCPDAFPTCIYTTPEIDTGNDGLVRIHGDVISMLGPGEAGLAAPALMIEARLSSGAYAGFVPWTVGDVNCRYFTEEIILTTALGKAFIESFAPTADAEPTVQSAFGLAISAAGTHITFPAPYRLTPSVTLTPVGTTGLIPVVRNVTTAGFDAFIYDTTNTSVGGVGNYQSSGV